MRLLLIFTMLVYFSSGSSTQTSSGYPKIELNRVDTFHVQVNAKLPLYKVIITILNVTRSSEMYDKFNLYRVSVFKEGESHAFQQFVDSSDGLVEGGFFEDQDRFVDVNFDGYKDIPLEVAESFSGYNHSYDFWLYDTSIGKFKFNEDFTCMNPYINKDEQLIETVSHDGCGGQCSTIEKYKVFRGVPLLIEREKYDVETDSTGIERYVHTIEQRINGELQTVSKEYQNEEDKNH